MGVRAGIVVTGTEVLTGRVADRNGPWLAEQLRLLGLDVGQIVVVGDRPDDLRAALGFLTAGHDLVITSGGLGPTADDLTAEVVAAAQGRPMALDPALEQRIAAVVERLTARLGVTWDPENTAAATRKQAMVPDGAIVLEPAGTAPGLVVPVADGRTGPPVVVLPGPPRELRRMWPAAVAAPPVRAVLAGAPELRQRTLRLWGVPESELAASLRRAGAALDGLEITTCLRDGELEIVSRYDPGAEPAHARLARLVRDDFGDRLFSDDGATTDEVVARGLAARGWRVAVAEAVTGGALAVRLTLGAESRFAGGEVVAGADPTERAARALAAGARDRWGAEVGIGIAGAGPQGGVPIAVVTPEGVQVREGFAVGSHELSRDRLAVTALHTLRRRLD